MDEISFVQKVKANLFSHHLVRFGHVFFCEQIRV